MTTTPRLTARIAGILYLTEIAAHGFGMFVLLSLVVRDDAAATAVRILASAPLYRMGFAADLLGIAAYVGVTALLYVLLKPVSKTLSFFASFFGLMGCAIFAANLVTRFAPLLVLGNAGSLAALGPDQSRALALTSLKVYSLGFNISMAFFGFYCLSIGFLVRRSTFLPRILGLLLMIAGLGYLINSFAVFLSPTFAVRLSIALLIPGIVAEGSLCLWLIVKGVDVERWHEQEDKR